MKKIIIVLFFLFFFSLIDCGGAPPTLHKFRIWIQGDSTNVKVNFENTKQEIFSTSKKEVASGTLDNIQGGYYINDAGIFGSQLTDLGISQSIYLDISSEKKSSFTISFLLSFDGEEAKLKKGSPLTYFFTNQNVTFDKGKLILDGVETEVSDYKYKK